MNNWIAIKSFADPKRLWFVRLEWVKRAASDLSLDMTACECASVSSMVQEYLNRKVSKGAYIYEL